MLDLSWENLDEAFASLEDECTNIVRGMTVEIFYGTLRMSPQYFGRYVASWTYSLNGPEYRSDTTFSPDGQQGKSPAVRQKNGGVAISVALQYNSGRDGGFKLGDTVWISNGVDHGEGPYAQAIEAGAVSLPGVMQPGRPLSRAIDRAVTWYGSTVLPADAERLKNMSL